MQIQPILGYFWAIFRLYQPPGPPFGSQLPLFTYPGSAPEICYFHTKQSIWSLYNFCLIHRYRPEIPKPAPPLSQHVAPIGVFKFFKQNNCDSSGAHVLWSEPEDKHAWNATWRSWMYFVCICFRLCGQQKPKYSQLEPHGWRRHYMGRYRSSGISFLYLWPYPNPSSSASPTWVLFTPITPTLL